MKNKRLKPQRRTPPTEEKRDYIIIAGSGPSAIGFPHADVATKKMSCPADYQAARYPAWYYKVQLATKAKTKPDPRYKYRPEKGFMLYKAVAHAGGKFDWRDIPNCYLAEEKYWNSYFKSFNPKNRNGKPSVGLCAVMMAHERWTPDEIGLIGFDYVLDGHKDWLHDSATELKVMRSLATIIDLRTGDSYPKSSSSSSIGAKGRK